MEAAFGCAAASPRDPVRLTVCRTTKVARRKLPAERKRYTSLAAQGAFAATRKRPATALAHTDFSV